MKRMIYLHFRVKVAKTVDLENVPVQLSALQDVRMGKVIMVM